MVNFFPWAKSSMWVLEWVKNNFCGGNKFIIHGFKTLLKPVLPIILKRNTIKKKKILQINTNIVTCIKKSIEAENYYETKCKQPILCTKVAATPLIVTYICVTKRD